MARPCRYSIASRNWTDNWIVDIKHDSNKTGGTMQPKDYVLAAGVVVTFLLGVWNAVVSHRNNRRSSFVNTVTSQRIKWIEQLRQDIGAFCGIAYHWSHSEMAGKPGEGEMLKELDRLRHVIRLRLNPLGKHDQAIEALINEIPHYTDPSRQQELVDALERMTRATQTLLKEEWDKVKSESAHGPLSERA